MNWPPLEANEILLPDPDPSEVLYRAISPVFLQQGTVDPDAFSLSTSERPPNPAKLSVARAALVDADVVRDEHNHLRPGACAEVRGVTVEQVDRTGLLRAIDDSRNVDTVTGHASIDCRLLVAEPRRRRQFVREVLAQAASDNPRFDTH